MGKTSYLSIDGQIVSEHRSGEARSRDYVLDPFGNVMGVYQADWAVAYMSFDPWGERVSGWNDSSYKFAWAGGWGYRQTNLEWSTHYVRARHYSFMDGGWTTVDPLWPREAAYRYVGGRVPRGVDPSGKWCLKCSDSIDDSNISGPEGTCLIACVADALNKGESPWACIGECVKGGVQPVNRVHLVEYILCRKALRFHKIKGDCSPCDEKVRSEVPGAQETYCEMAYIACLVKKAWDDISSKGVTRTARTLANLFSPSYGVGLGCAYDAIDKCGDPTFCGAGIDPGHLQNGQSWLG